MIFDNEFVFRYKKNIKYLLFEEDSDYLAIIFSGYSENKASYNYINCIDHIKCNKLYILDEYGYNNAGCWYLCENLNFEIEESIIKLIEYVQKKVNIKSENTISLGSSKGGFASLYYGIKCKLGHVISAGPQVLLGNYLGHDSRNNILTYMIGNNLENGKTILNNMILNQKPNKINKFYIFCGLDDSHLKDHVFPLIKTLSNENNPIYLDIFEGDHSNLGVLFAQKLNMLLPNIINNSIIFTNQKIIKLFLDEHIDIQNIDNNFILKNFNIEMLSQNKIIISIKPFNIFLDYTLLLKLNNKCIDYYSHSLNTVFSLDSNQLYDLYYTIKDKNYRKVFKFELNSKISTYNIIDVNNEPKLNYKLDINNFQPLYSNNNNVILLKLIDPNNHYDDIMYAFYILKNDKIIYTTRYTKKNELSYNIKESGSYSVVYFIRYNNKDILYKQTSSINIII